MDDDEIATTVDEEKLPTVTPGKEDIVLGSLPEWPGPLRYPPHVAVTLPPGGLYGVHGCTLGDPLRRDQLSLCPSAVSSHEQAYARKVSRGEFHHVGGIL